MIIQIIWIELELSLIWTERSLSTILPANTRDFKTPTQYPDVGDYKGRTRLSPSAAYPSTVGYRHIRRFPYTRAPRSCTKKLPIPPGPQPYESIGKGYRQTRRNNEPPPHPNLTLLLLIQVIWMIKHKVKHVKIMTSKLYASSYIMIITWKLYFSSYALLYKWYENLNLKNLFIVLFIPKVALLPRRLTLQVALLAPNTTKN
jgi:hypothetical protein